MGGFTLLALGCDCDSPGTDSALDSVFAVCSEEVKCKDNIVKRFIFIYGGF